MSTLIRYLAVNRSDEQNTMPDAGYSSICVGLFQDTADALKCAGEQLEQGYHVSIEHGEMPESEWEAIEEVSDDFIPTLVMTPDSETRESRYAH